MKQRFRYFLAVVVACASLAVAPVSAFSLFGDACGSGGAPGSAVCQEQSKTQSGTSNAVYGQYGALMLAANLLAFVVGVAAVIMIIISGITYMRSQGDSGKVQQAKNTIIYSVIGIVVVLLSRGFIAYIVTKV